MLISSEVKETGSSAVSKLRILQWKSGLITAGLLCIGLSIYFRIFSGFSGWDDEGYLMATIQAMLRGHLLYDQIYTLYGPFYYLIEWIFYGVTHLPVSHDCVRLIAMILWPTSAILIAWAAHRITGSLVLSGFTLFAVAKLLMFFDFEPGHPEEVCILLIASLFMLTPYNGGRVSNTRAIGYGFVLAALALTKINIGLYAILSLLLALALTRPQEVIKRMGFVALGITNLALIIVIMSPLASFSWVRNYCCFAVFSLLGALVVARVTPLDSSIDIRTLYRLGTAFGITALIVVAPFLVRGTTIPALLYVTVIQHKDFAQHWFKASPFNPISVIWSAGAVALALVWLRSVRARPENRSLQLAWQILKGALAMFATYMLLTSPAVPRTGLHTTLVIAPFSWLVLVPPSQDERTRQGFARAVLCFISVSLVMYGFPVWGSQWMFAAVPLVLVTAVFLNDARIAVCAWKPQLASPRSRQMVTAAALVVLASYYGRELREAYRTYADFVPLALPGASHIRVSRTDAETNQWLTRELNGRCPSFFSMPGLFSLYFWTHHDPPTMLMMNDWPAFFNARQQQSIIGDLNRSATACIVYNPDLVEFLRAGQDLGSSPLAQYIRAEFVPIDQRNGYYFMVKNNSTD